MKNFCFLFFFFLLAKFSFAQMNLVPNFSFELYDTCPNSQDQIQYATGWSKYSNMISTPDYYNACASSITFGIPHYGTFYQADHRNCGAFVGLVTRTNNPNDREQIGIQLSQTLVVGQRYYLSFYTVMCGFSDGTYYYESPANNIGMRLSTIAYNPNNPTPIDNVAHLHSTAVINDTANWVRITGSIIADSAYDYLILGNFYDDANTDTITLNCGTCLNNFSYYLIDDVCISTDSLLCNGGIDTLPCIASVPEINFDNISISPNPITDIVIISFENNLNNEIVLVDIYGKVIYNEKVNNRSSTSINLSSFSSGIYFIKVTDQKETKIIIKKIIKL